MAPSFSQPSSFRGNSGMVVAIKLDTKRARQRIKKDATTELELIMRAGLDYAQRLADQDLSPNTRAAPNSSGHPRRGLSTGHKRYRDSFIVRAEATPDNRVRVSLINDHPAWKILERGSRAHEIPKQPKTGKHAVEFPDGGGPPPHSGKGKFKLDGPPWWYAKQVNHPGTRPYRFMARTAQAIRQGKLRRKL